MHVAVGLVCLVAVVTLVTAVCRRWDLPTPLVLVLVGVAGSFVPGVPDVELSPDLVLAGFLPPLLYSAALRTSLVDFRRNLRPIALLSVGLVIVTTLVVGLVAWWLLPVPLAAGFALGAVVAPPDAVAAITIARQVGMPRRMVTILEGEGLVNDATALVALQTAIAAFGGAVTFVDVGLDFVTATLGGIAVGVAVALVTGKVRMHITDETIDTAISLITPFVAYLAAEALDFSGFLAVVVTGLIIGHKAHLLQSASSRIFERTNWTTIEFMLENTVFFLIGLQARDIIAAAADSNLSTGDVVVACVGVTLAVVLVRPVWVFPATYVPRLIPAIRRADPAPPWTVPAGISWAGMRGVVTLAAAFVLPTDTEQREVLILVALVVVGVTLLVQGGTLPWVLRRLGLSGPDPAEDALQVATLLEKVSAAGFERLDEVVGDEESPEVVNRLRRRISERSEAAWERLGGGQETPSQAYARLRTEMIAAERAELIRLRDTGKVPDDVLQQLITSIDIEETILGLGQSWASAERPMDVELTSPRSYHTCDHLDELTDPPDARTPEGCAECLEEGLQWVHLRLCMTCGHVGCCDSSVGRHATKHFARRRHPVMRSFESGEAWRWCYVDNRLG